MYATTETARMADLVLPAAGWGEKEGTFINSERRIGVIRKVRKAPGEALSDFNIFKLVAHYWGCGEMFDRWETPANVFRILKQCSEGQPCDITGIDDYQQIAHAGGIQWPVTAVCVDIDQERRLFEDGRFFHPNGRARFLFENSKPIPEHTNDRYRFVLLTGRGTASQWHTQTRTRQSAVLRKLYPEKFFAEINPHDAADLGIEPNVHVIVESQRGRVRARAFLTHSVQRGHVFLPMHYESVNQLTFGAFDPYSGQPAYKACAVRVAKDQH